MHSSTMNETTISRPTVINTIMNKTRQRYIMTPKWVTTRCLLIAESSKWVS